MCRRDGCVFSSAITYVFPILGVIWAIILSSSVASFGYVSIYVKEKLFTDNHMNSLIGISITTMCLLVFVVPVLGVFIYCLSVDSGPNIKQVYAYIIVLVVVMVFEIPVVPLAKSARREVQSTSKVMIPQSIFDAYAFNTSTRQALDQMQKKFHCCGGYNASDYTVQGLPVPSSCCAVSNCTEKDDSSYTQFYSKGCSQALADKMMTRVTEFTVIIVLLEFFHLVVLLLTIKVWSEARENRSLSHIQYDSL